MFSFRESYFRLVGLFNWVYARTKFLLLVSRNRYGFTLAGYRNEKYAADPALKNIYLCNIAPIYSEIMSKIFIFYQKINRILVNVIVHIHTTKTLQFGIY